MVGGMSDTKPSSLPLSTPDGEILAWACGVCRRVRCAAESWGPPDATKRASLAEFYREDADSCCVCRSCGKVEIGIRIQCEPCATVERAKREAERLAREAEEVARAQAQADTFACSLDPEAARALAKHMSNISEDCYCAGWLSGLEYSLWDFMVDGPGEWGMGEVSVSDVTRLRELSAKAGGWIVWRAGVGETFVQLADWPALHNAEKERTRAWLAAYEATGATQESK